MKCFHDFDEFIVSIFKIHIKQNLSCIQLSIGIF